MTKRDFLAECDIILAYLCTYGANSGPNINTFQTWYKEQNFKFNIHDLLNYMSKERNHIWIWSGFSAATTPEGRMFALEHSYVREYDLNIKPIPTTQIINVEGDVISSNISQSSDLENSPISQTTKIAPNTTDAKTTWYKSHLFKFYIAPIFVGLVLLFIGWKFGCNR